MSAFEILKGLTTRRKKKKRREGGAILYHHMPISDLHSMRPSNARIQIMALQ